MENSPRFSQVLQSLADLDQEKVEFTTVVAAMGTRVHATALLVLALPETVPLPLPSASAIPGIPLLLIAGHLALFGENSGLPQRIRNLAIPTRIFQLLLRYLGPALRVLERVSRPRWPAVAERERVFGVVCAFLAIILLLPLPLVNAPAGLLSVIAWGMIQKDGFVIAIGVIGSALLTAFLLGMVAWFSERGLAPLLEMLA